MPATQTGITLDSVEFHQDSKTYQARFDQATTSASLAVVAALSEVMDADPTALDPLHYTVDADALDALLRVRDTTVGDTQVTFTHEEYVVTIYSYGVVEIAPRRLEGIDDLTKAPRHQ